MLVINKDKINGRWKSKSTRGVLLLLKRKSIQRFMVSIQSLDYSMTTKCLIQFIPGKPIIIKGRGLWIMPDTHDKNGKTVI